MTSPTQSLVIPAFNEAGRLAAGFERLEPTLELMGVEQTEIVMVDDGSRDDTLRVAQRTYGHLENFRLVQHPHNMGKGAAVRTGLAHARGDQVIVTDADMSIRPEHFGDVLHALERAPFAPGSRTHHGVIRYDSWRRTLSGAAFHALVRHYTSVAVRDTQCGCKGFELPQGRLIALFGVVTSFAYDVELYFLADRLGLMTESVAVTWDDIEGSTVSLAHGTRRLLGDLRSIARTRYECPAVELAPDVLLDDVRTAAREARGVGLVLARARANALVVFPRNGAVAAMGLAQSLGGSVRTTTLGEMRERRFEAV